MSHPAKASRNRIGGQANVAQGRSGAWAIHAAGEGAERMQAPESLLLAGHPAQAGVPVAAVDVGTVVHPGRVRNRTKTELDEKIKKPADGVRKKSPPARKAPARGRYVDEYARPAC